jgi:hypothetical protein
MTTMQHGYKPGDLVQTWYADDGRGGGYCYGIVTSAGPKRVGVTWESGRRNSLHRDRWRAIAPVPDRMRDVALDATKRVRAELLAKITAKSDKSGKLNTYALEPDGTVRRVKS